MSYIRSPYNPEALYIWSQDDGKCYFVKGFDHIGTMPTDVFDGLIKAYVEEDADEFAEYEGAMVEEVWVRERDGIVENDENKQPFNSNLQTRLSYGDWHIDMWDVTWYYIAHSNYFRVKPNLVEKILNWFNKRKFVKNHFYSAHNN